MSTSIKLKKSSISGRIPSTGDLDYGELAINYADGILYFKNSGNTVQSITASPSGIDSTATINLIDSAYIQARQSSTGGTDPIFKTISVSGQSDVVADVVADTLTLAAGSGMTITTDASTDTITFSSISSGLDSAAVVNIIDSAVNQTFVNNLNVNADTLDGQEGSYYLNYNNLTNVPAGGASSPQGVDYGSIIVTATSAIDLLIAAFTVDYGTPNAPAGLISDYGAI